MKYIAAIITVLSLCASDALAVSCQAQANRDGPRCVAAGKNCPSGFRPVFYDDPKPCSNGMRCCIKG